MPEEALVPWSHGVVSVSIAAYVTRSAGTPRTSAATWQSAVEMPWPISTDPALTYTSPVAVTLTRAWAGLLTPPPSLKPMARPMPRCGCAGRSW